MPALVMRPLARRLKRCGFRSLCWSYPSVRATPAGNARALGRLVRREAGAAGGVHLVAHSLGGLVALLALHEEPQLPVERLVLLGSPVRGSAVARRLARTPWLHPLLGRTRDILTEGVPLPARLPPTGVIVGTRPVGQGRLFLPGLPRPNDGMVTVAETELPQAADRIEVHCTHTGLLFSREVAQAVCRFLREGRFR